MQSVDMDASFVYNENGLRVQKTANGVVTKYTLHGKNIVHMTSGSDELHFFYDAQNKPAVVVYNGTAYAYVKNLQGDVVALLDSTGVVVVSYAYDAWGKPISKTGSMASTLGKINPFRYRGYVYDEETGLYYLRSRYYTVQQCRFVNADVLYNGNLMTYAANNPIYYGDKSGYEICTMFSDCGFGNPFASLTGGVSVGGGSCGGFAGSMQAYSHGGVMQGGGPSDEGRSEALSESFKKLALFLYDELCGIYSMGDLLEYIAIEGSVAAGLYFTSQCTMLAGPAGFVFGFAITSIWVGTVAGIAPEVATQIDGIPRDEEHMLESMATETTAYAVGYVGLKKTTEKKVAYIMEKILKAIIH